MASKPIVAVKKRQLIAKANKTIFISVAIASIVVSVCAAISVSLAQRLAYNEKVLSAKSDTVENLKLNNDNAANIISTANLLNTNERLIELQVEADESPKQVVLDALPAVVNPAAAAASLESEALLGRGVELTSLSPDTKEQAEESGSIGFKFTLEADSKDEALGALTRLEKSIRAFSITTLSIEQNGDRVTMAVEGQAFYEESKQITLGKEKVPR